MWTTDSKGPRGFSVTNLRTLRSHNEHGGAQWSAHGDVAPRRHTKRQRTQNATGSSNHIRGSEITAVEVITDIISVQEQERALYWGEMCAHFNI